MRIKRGSQPPLPLVGGGPTNPGYSTVMYNYVAREKKRAIGPPSKPRAGLGAARQRWLLNLFKEGPKAWPSRRTKTPDDCMTLGWTEWAKGPDGEYIYDESLDPPRVCERLTAEGRVVVSALLHR